MSDLSFSTMKEIYDYLADGNEPGKLRYRGELYFLITKKSNHGANEKILRFLTHFDTPLLHFVTHIDYHRDEDIIIGRCHGRPLNYYSPHDLTDPKYIDPSITGLLKLVLAGDSLYDLPDWCFVVLGAAKSAGHPEVNEISDYLRDNIWDGAWEHFYKMTGATIEG